MSGYANISGFPDQNILYNAASGATLLANQHAQNQLLTDQQDISSHEMEMTSRLAGTLLSQYQTPEARAAAYPTLLAQARAAAPGYFKNAPATYPGDDVAKAFAQMGVSSADLYKLQLQQAGGQDTLRALGIGSSAAPAAPAAGGGGELSPDKTTALQQIAKRESGGDVTALNYVAKQDPTAYARGATASGKYQIVNSTWREGMQLAGLDPAQYATARDAPEGVQDKVAGALYDKYGTSPWQKGSKDWIRDEQGQYQLATVRPAAPPTPPGGGVVARNPGAVQVAGPGAGSGGATAAQTPLPPEQAKAQAKATGQPVPVAGVAGYWALPSGSLVNQLPATATQAAPATPATTTTVPGLPPPPQTNPATGFTPTDEAVLTSMARGGYTREQILAEADKRRTANTSAQRQYTLDVQARQDKATEQARQAEELRLRQGADRRAQAELDQKMVMENRPYPGNTPESADMNILIAGSQPGGDPSSVEYRNAYARQKYKEASNGNVIARDMSMFKPPAAADTAPTVTAGPQQVFERENKLRDEFQKLTADFRVVQNSYENLHAAAEKPSGAGDMSLLYSYVRLLDPTSVVRESEFAAAAASGSFGERVQGAVNRILSGERMPDTLRQDFVREARNLYDTQLRNHNQTADIYTNLATQSGVDPKKVVTRFDRPQADSTPTKPPPPGYTQKVK